MEEFEVKFLYIGDNRPWENIPVANKKPLTFEHLEDAENAITSFIKVWNKLNSTDGTPIFQARLNRLGWFNGHYLSDWDNLEAHLNSFKKVTA